jgi:hypothetical protein
MCVEHRSTTGNVEDSKTSMSGTNRRPSSGDEREQKEKILPAMCTMIQVSQGLWHGFPRNQHNRITARVPVRPAVKGERALWGRFGRNVTFTWSSIKKVSIPR